MVIILQVPYSFLCHSILKMGIDATDREGLSLILNCLIEELVLKSSIISMVMLDSHTMGCCKGFKSLLCLDHLFGSQHLLEMDITESAQMIDRYGCCIVPGTGRYFFQLCNQSWHCQFQLINGHAIAWFLDDHHGYLVDRTFHSPWLSSCLSVGTATANGCSHLH